MAGLARHPRNKAHVRMKALIMMSQVVQQLSVWLVGQGWALCDTNLLPDLPQSSSFGSGCMYMYVCRSIC